MIAYGTGKAGQWSKGEADRRFDQILWRTVLVAILTSLPLGAALGVSLLPDVYRYLPVARRVPVAAYWATAAALFAAGGVGSRLLMRAAGGPIGRLARERVRHLDGGQAEALVAYQLRTLGDDWHLFNGIAMAGGGGDVDHVLVGPGGLFCVSTKSHRGLYAWDAAGRTATLNGRPTDHVRQAQAMAMQLRHWLEARLRPEHGVTTVPFVHPVLCVPMAAVELPDGVTRVRVVDGRELRDLADRGVQPLRPAAVRGCVAVLRELTGWEPMPRPPLPI